MGNLSVANPHGVVSCLPRRDSVSWEPTGEYTRFFEKFNRVVYAIRKYCYGL